MIFVMCLSVCQSFSCLRDKVYIFGRSFVKLTQFVYIINSLNPIDFEKSDNQQGKSSHFKSIICISCLCYKVCFCFQNFGKLAQFIYIINVLNPIDFEINLIIRKEKVATSRCIFLNCFFKQQ